MSDAFRQLTGVDSARVNELGVITKHHSEIMRNLGLAERLTELRGLRTSLPAGFESALSKAVALEEQIAPFRSAMKAMGTLKPPLTALEGLSKAAGFVSSENLAAVVGSVSKVEDYFRSMPKIADFFPDYSATSQAFENLTGYRKSHDLALAMDLFARNLITEQQSALKASGILETMKALRPLDSVITAGWELPEWRAPFEQVANVSLALNIGSWSGRRRAEQDEERFVDLRRTQADEDRILLDALIDEFMPSLREGIDGAREILKRRSADYRTQFAASARKAIDLVAKRLAPRVPVSAWVGPNPSRARNRKGELLVTFDDQLGFMFRDASQSARDFFVQNGRTIVQLRSELSDLNHVNGTDPHHELVENMQLVERLLLHILLEVQRRSSC